MRPLKIPDWHGVRSADWSHGIASGASNWYSLPPPSGVAEQVPNGEAIFASGALRREILVTKPASIGAMRFPSDAPQYSFRLQPGGSLSLKGAGLVNHSGFAPRFVVADAILELTGTARFLSPGPAKSALINTHGAAVLRFSNHSRGGDATVINNAGGQTAFEDSSRADQMTIINRSSPGLPTRTVFWGESSIEDRPDLINERDSELVFLRYNGARKVENDGNLRVGFFRILVATDFSQTANGTLFFTSASGDARVVALGAARLNGDLVFQGNTLLKVGEYIAVQGNAGRIGQFANVTFKGLPATLRGRIRYTPKQAIVVIERR